MGSRKRLSGEIKWQNEVPSLVWGSTCLERRDFRDSSSLLILQMRTAIVLMQINQFFFTPKHSPLNSVLRKNGMDIFNICHALVDPESVIGERSSPTSLNWAHNRRKMLGVNKVV